MSNTTETQEQSIPTIVDSPPPYQSELAPEFAHEAAPEPATEKLSEQPEGSELESAAEALDTPSGLGPAPEPSRRESQVLPTLVLVPEPAHESEPEEPKALPHPKIAAVVPALMPTSAPVSSTVAIANEPSVSPTMVKAAAVPASIPAPASTTVTITGKPVVSSAAVKATTGDLGAALKSQSPTKELKGSNQAYQATQDVIEHVNDSVSDKSTVDSGPISPPQTVVEDSEAFRGPAPVPEPALPEPETSPSPETPSMHENSAKGADVTLAPEDSPSVISTTNTQLSASQRMRRRVANRIAVLRCPKEVIPIILHLSQKKKKGEDINPIVEAMMKAVGAPNPRRDF